jgi:hypothetical protein
LQRLSINPHLQEKQQLKITRCSPISAKQSTKHHTKICPTINNYKSPAEKSRRKDSPKETSPEMETGRRHANAAKTIKSGGDNFALLIFEAQRHLHRGYQIRASSIVRPRQMTGNDPNEISSGGNHQKTETKKEYAICKVSDF